MSLGIEIAKKLFSFYADHGVDRKDLYIGDGHSAGYIEVNNFSFWFGRGKIDLECKVVLPEGIEPQRYKALFDEFNKRNKKKGSYMKIAECEPFENKTDRGYKLTLHFAGKNDNDEQKGRAFVSVKSLVNYLLSHPYPKE